MRCPDRVPEDLGAIVLVCFLESVDQLSVLRIAVVRRDLANYASAGQLVYFDVQRPREFFEVLRTWVLKSSVLDPEDVRTIDARSPRERGLS